MVGAAEGRTPHIYGGARSAPPFLCALKTRTASPPFAGMGPKAGLGPEGDPGARAPSPGGLEASQEHSNFYMFLYYLYMIFIEIISCFTNKNSSTIRSLFF